MRVATAVRLVVVLVVALVVTAVAVLLATDFSTFRSDVEAIVQGKTGRDLKIGGAFDLRLGFTPAVTVKDVRLANAPWGSRPDMATIRRLDIEVQLLPLLIGDIRIKRLVLVGGDILIETNAEGRGNWMFDAGAAAAPAPGEAGETKPSLPRFDRIRIEGARIVWRDGKSGAADEITITSLDAEVAGADAPLRTRLRAQYGGSPVSLEGTFGSISALVRGETAWPFDLHGRIGGAELALQGSARAPLAGRGINASLSVKGEDLAKLGALAGASLPPLGSYRFEARLSDEGKTWTANNLTVALGRSSAAGEVSIDLGPAPPKVRAVLTAPLVDLGDFVGREGAGDGKPAAPAPPSGAPPPPAAAPAAGVDAGKRRVIPDTRLPLDALAAIDAKVSVRIARLIAGSLAFRDAEADLRLERGTLSVRPLQARLAGAPVKAELRARKAGGKASNVVARFGAEKVDLAALLKAAGKPGLASGKVDFSADLQGTGTTLRALLAGSNGTFEVVMQDGKLSHDTIGLLSADIVKAISPWSSQGRDLKINCLVGRYDIHGGKVNSRATLFDSDRVAVTADGGLNLATEQIGFTLVPHAKEASLLRLAVPIRVTGTFADPVVFPDAGYIAKGAVNTVIGLPGEVIDGTIGRILGAGNGGENRCVAALKHGGKAAAAPGKPAGPVEGVGRALEGIGKGIGEGLKNLFGK